MKRLLLISVLLAFLSAAPAARALTAENVAVSVTGGSTLLTTGGIVVAGEASSSGSTSADSGVRSVVRTESTNTRVHVEVSASSDGGTEATSSVQMSGLRNRSSAGTVGAGRFEVVVPRDNADDAAEAHVAVEASLATSAPSSSFFNAWTSFKVAFTKLYSLLFFWEQ